MSLMNPAEVTFTVQEEPTPLYAFSPLERAKARNATSLNSTIRISLSCGISLGLGLAMQGEPRFTLLSPCCGAVINEVYSISPEARYSGAPITTENASPGLVPECSLCKSVFPKGSRAHKAASKLPLPAVEAMVSKRMDPLGAAIVARALDDLTLPWAALEPEELARVPHIWGPGEHALLNALPKPEVMG